MAGKKSRRGEVIALGYDLAMQGGPEVLFLGPRRRELIGALQGMVLEIGAGTGLSLEHYSTGTRIIATEPDLASLDRLAERAGRMPGRVSPVAADAMHLPFPEGTFDALVCNLALCTIPDPSAALAEARRVLKPGGSARFLEHVRSSARPVAGMQDLLAPLWAHVAGGCRLNQDTESLVRASGLLVERVRLYGGLVLPMKLIWAHNGPAPGD